MSQFNSDNCFFATPKSVDRLFAQLEGNYVESFKLMTTRTLEHSRPERQLWTAAVMAGLPVATPCGPMHASTRPRSTKPQRGAPTCSQVSI
jgi:hypothetical protein